MTSHWEEGHAGGGGLWKYSTQAGISVRDLIESLPHLPLNPFRLLLPLSNGVSHLLDPTSHPEGACGTERGGNGTLTVRSDSLPCTRREVGAEQHPNQFCFARVGDARHPAHRNTPARQNGRSPRGRGIAKSVWVSLGFGLVGGFLPPPAPPPCMGACYSASREGAAIGQ